MDTLRYLLWQNIKEIRRTPKVFAVVVVTLAVGLAAFASCVTLLQAITQDPLPGKSQNVYRVSMDNWPVDDPFDEEHPPYMPYQNALDVMQHNSIKHSALLFASYLFVNHNDNGEERYIDAMANASTIGLFGIMGYQFDYGSHWKQGTALRNIVISHQFNQNVFNGENSVGKQVVIKGVTFSVSGVLSKQSVSPNFHTADYKNDIYFGQTSDLFLPLETAIDIEASVNGNISYHGAINSNEELRTKPIFFLHFWLEFDTTEDTRAFASYLNDYAQQQKMQGKHPLPVNNHMNDVLEWSRKTNLVDESIVALSLASALLLVTSLFNASSVMLNRLQKYQAEFKLRRALGASRGQLLLVALVMVMMLSLVVAVPAAVLNYFFIKELGQLFDAYRSVIEFNAVLVGTTITLSFMSVCLCSAYPYLRNIFAPIDRQLSV